MSALTASFFGLSTVHGGRTIIDSNFVGGLRSSLMSQSCDPAAEPHHLLVEDKG
jgi:hypothetical protein